MALTRRRWGNGATVLREAHGSSRLGVLVLLVVASAAAVAAQEVPASWVRYPWPSGLSPERDCAQWTRTGWILTLDDTGITEHAVAIDAEGRRQDALPYDIEFHPLMLGPYPPPPPPPLVDAATGQQIERRVDYDAWARSYLRGSARRVVFRVEDGWLVSFDAGEFGGSLWWFPTEPGSGLKLCDRNIRLLVRHPHTGEVLAFLRYVQGIGTEPTALQVMRGEHVPWAARELPPWGFEPTVTEPLPDGDLLVAGITAQGDTTVARVRSGEIIETVATAATPSSGAQPQSVLLAPSGDIYVGLPMFVLRLRSTTTGYEPEYYIPSGCSRFHNRRFRNVRYECVCEGGVAPMKLPVWAETMQVEPGDVNTDPPPN